MTSALFDRDKGWLMLRATCVDFSLEGDPVPADFTSGSLPTDADIAATDENVETWIPKPQ